MTAPIDTGQKWFGQRILIESSGDKDVDAALKSTFRDGLIRSAPLEVTRPDCRLLLTWAKYKEAGL